MLLLPQFPFVNNMNHHNAPNIAIRKRNGTSSRVDWDMPGHTAFAHSEEPKMWVDYVVLRDIHPGDEMVIDYGTTAPNGIELSDEFFVPSWIHSQHRNYPLPVVDTTTLQVGEIDHVRIANGGSDGTTSTPLAPFLHRIGLPIDLTDKLLAWAEDLGLIRVLTDAVLRDQLNVNGESRVRLNGGTWWIKRFDSSWASDM